jgi:ubiquitin-protein ligase
LKGTEVELVDGKVNDFYVSLKPEYGLYYRAHLKFHVVVPEGYPHKPPTVTADTLIYHPNVDRTTGEVPLSSWWGREPGFRGIRRLLGYLIVITRAPDVLHPVNFPATLLVESDLHQFEENVERALKGEIVDGTQYTKLID